MNKYNEEIRRYERAAEEHFDDFDNDDFNTGLEGRDDNFEDNFEDQFEDQFEDSFVEEQFVSDNFDDNFDNYAANSIGTIDPNDRTLTITVQNSGATDLEAIIFGGNENAAQQAGVTVTVQESSHNEVREESKGNPFKILGMKMSVSDPLQFDNVWKILRRTSTGSSTSRPYQPRNATSPQNTNQKPDRRQCLWHGRNRPGQYSLYSKSRYQNHPDLHHQSPCING